MAYGFFNDDPVDGSNEFPDLLGHKRYADHAIGLLEEVRTQTESGVLALIGPWGSGKSSVLKMALRKLRSSPAGSPQWSIAELNPWLYSDLESLTLALFSEIREALPAGDKWSAARQKIAAYGQAISPLGKLTTLLGVDSSELIKSLSTRIGGDGSASAARRTAAEALRAAEHPVLVVMDDLDRLTPSELLLVFKLVRLAGNLPNVYYLISFDEHTLLDVLQRSDLVRDSPHRAGEFLEKIIQVRLDLPAFRSRDAAVLIDQSLTALLDSHQLSMTDEERERFSRAYFRCMEEHLTTPRAIKRYFSQAAASLRPLAREVDLVDFLLVTFLRTNEPGVYRLLGRHRAELTGTSLKMATIRETPDQRRQTWRRRLIDVGVEEQHADGVLRLLSMMFAPLARSFEESSSDPAVTQQRRSIGSGDYFDRYVMFGVPEDDLSESMFDTALAQLAAGTPGQEAAELLLRLENDTHRVGRRLRQRLQAGVAMPAAELLVAIAELYGTLKAEKEGLFSADASARFLAQDLFRTFPDTSRTQVIVSMAHTPQGAALAGNVLFDATHSDNPDEQQEPLAWAVPARAALSRQMERHLSAAGSRPAEDLAEVEVDLIWRWRHAVPDSARAWIQQRLADGTWQLLPLLTGLIQPTPGRLPVVDAETLASLDALIDRNDVYALIGQSGATPAQEVLLMGLRQIRDHVQHQEPAE